MPNGSRRYFVTTLPVEHINGKMASSSTRCKNTYTPEEDQTSYYYGYRRHKKNVSRYALRSIPRDLNTKPYTAEENANKALFTASIAEVQRYRREPQAWSKCIEEFNQQNNYATPIGFAIATCRKNGGEWPSRWQDY